MVSLEQSLVRIANVEQARKFMQAVFSPSEIKSIQHRWEAFQLLLAGSTQRSVASKLSISIATVSRAAAVLTTDRPILNVLFQKRKQRSRPSSVPFRDRKN